MACLDVVHLGYFRLSLDPPTLLKLAKKQGLNELEYEILVIENKCQCTFFESTQTALLMKVGDTNYADVI